MTSAILTSAPIIAACSVAAFYSILNILSVLFSNNKSNNNNNNKKKKN